MPSLCSFARWDAGHGCGSNLDYKYKDCIHNFFIVQELCESRGGRPGPVRPNEPSGFRGRKDLLNRTSALVTTCP